ncbi:hypothetical protein ABZ934_23555 [Streptomyces sp. NPDC046557]|uniref:hypothetical protein n=1 Tax=Streptomyces sp. NPDC046557 TaxID=3155372 RepID=UPI0033F28F8A
MTRIRKLVTLLAACAFPLLVATPASASVDSHCGKYICVMTAHHNRFRSIEDRVCVKI